MTRAKHSALATDVPVYALGFLDDVHVAYAGGGGAGRSGIANAIHCAELGMRGDEPVLRACGEIKLRGDEDAPMCLAVNRPAAQLVCGINASEAELRSGRNEEMRVFSYVVGDSASQVAIRSVVRAPSLGITDGSHYVRAAAFSPGGDLLAFASTDGRIQLYRWPSREPVWRSEEGVFTRGDEVCDVDFSADGRQVAFTTPSKLVILATAPRQVPGLSPYRVLQTIRDPTIGADQRASLRAAKFGRGSDDDEAMGSQDLLYTLVNAPTSGRSKARESYITAWNADTWEMIATRKVSTRPATVLAVSPDGLLLACASSDLSITVLQALTLKPVLRVVSTHDFPPTCLAFSPNSRHLASGSADSTIRVMNMPPALAAGTSRMGTMVYFILCVLLLLAAIYIAHRSRTG